MKYGDPTDDSTDYKYITCAVNGMSDDDMVVARFWVKINDTIYYAKYAGHNYKYTGCMTKANLETVAE
jgi:co-chaperonin GroES (HSP10)